MIHMWLLRRERSIAGVRRHAAAVVVDVAAERIDRSVPHSKDDDDEGLGGGGGGEGGLAEADDVPGRMLSAVGNHARATHGRTDGGGVCGFAMQCKSVAVGTAARMSGRRYRHHHHLHR